MLICEGRIGNNMEGTGRGRNECSLRRVLRGLRNTTESPIKESRSSEYYRPRCSTLKYLHMKAFRVFFEILVHLSLLEVRSICG